MWETGAEMRRKQAEQSARRKRARPGAGGRGRSLTLAVAALLALVAVFNIAVIHVYHSSSRLAAGAMGAAGTAGAATDAAASPDSREAQARHARAHALQLAAAEGNATEARWASWADLSKQITDAYASVLGSDMAAVMRAALLEISPANAQPRDAGGGSGAQQMPVAEGPCYAGPRTGQVPWWLARHDRLVELPATRRCAVKYIYIYMYILSMYKLFCKKILLILSCSSLY
jgi:hypothetical protein